MLSARIKPPGIERSCVAPQVAGEFELPLLAVQRHGSLELEKVELGNGAVKLIDLPLLAVERGRGYFVSSIPLHG